MVRMQASAAIGQAPIGSAGTIFPLFPIITTGVPDLAGDIQYPLEIAFDYDAVPVAVLDQPSLPGLARWAPLLPPLADISLGEGGTPLVPADHLAPLLGLSSPFYLKDESRNPTWSHKDRLNLCAVSAVRVAGGRGIAVASSGNHGVSAAAYAARAGLPCIVVTSPHTHPAFIDMIHAFGAGLIVTPSEQRWACLARVVDETGFVPVSNLTRFHTSAAFGPEGYKTIAYEIFQQLGRTLPGTVVVPTGYGELLFGIVKGFQELERFGLSHGMPQMMSAEPSVGAPLAHAWHSDLPAAEVTVGPSLAKSIASPVSGYRGIWALRESGGRPLTFEEETLRTMRDALARAGLFQEMSGVAALAAIRDAVSSGAEFNGPVVAILTSSGLKDIPTFHGEHETSTEDDIATLLAGYADDVGREVPHG
jgi:threonine synthase